MFSGSGFFKTHPRNNIFPGGLCCLILFLLIIPSRTSFSQVYPVRTQLILSPPYPANLEGFSSDGGSHLQLRIYPADLNLSNYPVKVRLVLNSDRLTLTSGDWFMQEPIYLNGGVTLTLDGHDLAPWFSPDNLTFSGYSKSQYLRSLSLPEGFYTLSFDVLDYYRNIPISSGAPAIFWLSLSEPPLLNFPLNGTEITASDPVNILFSWTTRHSAMVYPGFLPLYLLELWDIIPADRNPSDIVRTTPPVFSITTDNPQYQYSISDPLLITGHHYAWRIRETDPENKAVFRNEGYSDVNWFIFGRPCDSIQPSIGSVGSDFVRLHWTGNEGYSSFEVCYREKELSNANWYADQSLSPEILIPNLKPNTVYEFRLMGYCGNQSSDYSSPVVARTSRKKQKDCGQSLSIPPVENSNPLPLLRPGESIHAADFDVEVRSVRGSNGIFSGAGYLLVPWFNSIRIEVTFDNIVVNELYQLASGQIRSVYNLSNALAAPLPVSLSGNSATVENPFPDVTDMTVQADSSVREVVLLEEGTVLIISSSGDEKVIDPGGAATIAITSPEGKQFVVDRQSGTVYSADPSSAGELPSSPASGKGTGFAVDFLPDPEQLYGFDAPGVNDPPDNYNTVGLGDEEVPVPWKSVESGKMDRLTALIHGSPPDSVHFSRNSGKLVMCSPGSDKTRKELLVTGDSKKDEDELSAWSARYEGADTIKVRHCLLAGKANLVTYERQYANLMLVPVNHAPCPDPRITEDYLNKVYAPAMITFHVLQADSFLVPLIDPLGKELNNTDLNDRMDYTDEMDAVNKAFKKLPAYTRNGVYLFLVEKSKDPSSGGFMPFHSRFGYIFRNYQSPDEILHTIAHELSHGAFNLRHTFSELNKYQQPQGSTDNLLDYSQPTATRLYKYQWDEIQDPKTRLNFFEEEEESELSLPCLGWFDDCDDVLKILETVRNARINGHNLKVKSQQNLNEKTLSASSIRIANTEYNRIRLTYAPENIDYVFDPLEYEEYNQQFLNSDGKIDHQRGFGYFKDGKCRLKIILDDTGRTDSLKEYLYGSGIKFQVISNNKILKENEYVTISSEPKMPKLIIKNTDATNLDFRLEIEYRRDIRRDEDYFPETGWQTVKSGKEWEIDFGNKIRGGKATLLYKVGQKEYSFVFHIRGTNPTEQQVKQFIDEKGYNIWFLTRLIRQESSYHQFNLGTKYGPNWNNTQGCPNWGPPHGWGLMQMDVLNSTLGDQQAAGAWRPSAQALWDWKENIKVGVNFLRTEKFDMVNDNLSISLSIENKWYNKHPEDIITAHPDQEEGNNSQTVIYTHTNSSYFSYNFGGNPANNKKSFMDASWIKNYNGSSGGTDDYPGYYYVLKQLDKDIKPFWDLHRTNSNNENYVSFVSGRIE